MRPGVWSGACVYTGHNLAQKFLSQTKWEKLKLCVKWCLDHDIKISVANKKNGSRKTRIYGLLWLQL
jgi:hypothetical protein